MTSTVNLVCGQMFKHSDFLLRIFAFMFVIDVFSIFEILHDTTFTSTLQVCDRLGYHGKAKKLFAWFRRCKLRGLLGGKECFLQCMTRGSIRSERARDGSHTQCCDALLVP